MGGPSKSTPFSVFPTHLSQLGPEESVRFFTELLWAEATADGLARTLVVVPSNIDAPDGGIDAQVDMPPGATGGDLHTPDCRKYQIKAGSFSPATDRSVNEVLFDSKGLRTRVRTCLDAGETLTVVLFGWDNPERTDDYLVKRFQTVLAAVDPKYGAAKIRVLSQGNLISLFEKYPSLALRLNGNRLDGIYAWHGWSRFGDMQTRLHLGETQTDTIDSVREYLRTGDEARHVHLYGDPGIGKTRLVLECARADDIAPLTLYSDQPSALIRSGLLHTLGRADNQFHVVLVVDECAFSSRAQIWNQLSDLGHRVRLITIYNEREAATGTTKEVGVGGLGDEEVQRILRDYGVHPEHQERWAELCSGSPRVAHVVGANLQSNPSDVLQTLDNVDVWGRYLAGSDDPNSQTAEEKRTVLRFVALFKKFGFGPSVQAEAQFIAQLVAAAFPGITWLRFKEIINRLKSQRVLQGEDTLYITPKALHIKLWREWWESYGTDDVSEFLGDLPGKLQGWFIEMFRYAAESGATAKLVNRLLAPGGPCAKLDFLNSELGGRFFFALTETNPTSALACLQSAIGARPHAELEHLSAGRHWVVRALEAIAVWRDTFAAAARILLDLAEAENESWANNASGVFVGLFSPGPGRTAPTELPPIDRLEVLEGELKTASSERRNIIMRAFDTALETGQFSRVVGAEYQGIRVEPKLWTPQTYGEWHDGYRATWTTLRQHAEQQPDSRVQAGRVLARNARGIGTIPNFEDEVLDTLRTLAEWDVDLRKMAIQATLEALHYDADDREPESLQKWRELHDALSGSGFSAELQRYVRMSLFEDQWEAGTTDRTDAHAKRLGELSAQALADPGLLNPELPWLTSERAENGYAFGRALGEKDDDLQLLDRVLGAQRQAGENGSPFFLAGYLAAVADRDSERWEETIDALAADSDLRRHVAELTWRSGKSDRSLRRILELAKEGAVEDVQLKYLAFGGVVRDLSDPVFRELIEYLLERQTPFCSSIAVQLLDYRYDKSAPQPISEDLTLLVLMDPVLLRGSPRGQRDHMDDHHWVKVAERLVKAYPVHGLDLARALIGEFEHEESLVDFGHRTVRTFLRGLIRAHAPELWPTIKANLGPPFGGGKYRFGMFLRGVDFFGGGDEQDSLSLLPLEEFWGWIDEDVENRAWYAATLVPKTLHHDAKRPCLPRELLMRYGDREDVRSSLAGNFSSEGWSGPTTRHIARKIEHLREFREKETDRNVLRWLDEYIGDLEQHLEAERIREEREW